jgi:hypothetical protein
MAVALESTWDSIKHVDFNPPHAPHTVTVLNVEMFHETFELHTLLVAEVFASVLWIQIYLGHMLDAC